MKIVSLGNQLWKQSDLADALGISRAEISNSLQRSIEVGLLNDRKVPQRAALIEFIQHALKYLCSVKPGSICRGIRTSHSAVPLAKKLIANQDDVYVWPWPEGDARGQSIEPIYHSVPIAIKNDSNLYELLALVDAVRVGRVREQNIALDELKRRIKG